MGPLNDENNLQVEEKNKQKTEMYGKYLKMNKIIKLKTIRYKLTATGNIIIHSILNFEPMRPFLQFTAT